MADITGVGSIFDFFSTVVDKIFPDKTQAFQAKQAFAQAQLAGQLAEEQALWDNAKAQAATNTAEAANTSVFVAGWRPFVGWISGGALAWNFVVYPLFAFAASLVGHPVDPKTVPELDIGLLGQLLLGMLGLGIMRTYEKVKGVAPQTHA